MSGQPSQERVRARSIGHYILGKTIGEGTFGKVKLGTHILTGEKVAVKILEKERIVDIADVERVAREIHILKLIRHPHIIQLYEIIETPRQLYLIMEYASGGELFDYIVAHSRVKELEACRFFHQILAGVEKVHAMNVVHRDLKPENLLLDEHRNIKIVDFGLSNTFQDGALLKTACGSPCYAAPEMIAGKKYVPSLCDIWSCGVILFALICGYLPFEDQNTACLYKKILKGEYQAPSFLSDAARDLIRKMLTTDPTKRFQIAEIRSHAWFSQVSGACIEGAWMDQDAPQLDEQILAQLERLGFPQEYAVKCLQMNKHNHVTTTYCLLLEKKRRMVERLVATGAPMEALPASAPLSARAEQRPAEEYAREANVDDYRAPYTPGHGAPAARDVPRPTVPWQPQTPGHAQPQTPHTARAGYPHSARGAPSPRTQPAQPASARGPYRERDDMQPRSRVSSAGSASSRDNYPSYKPSVTAWASPRRRSPVTLGYVTPRGPTATAVVDRLYGGSRSGASSAKPAARPHSVGSTERQYAPTSARLQSRSSTPTTRRTTSPHPGAATPSRQAGSAIPAIPRPRAPTDGSASARGPGGRAGRNYTASMGAHGTQAPHSARARVGGAPGPGGPPFSARGSSADKGPERVRGAFNVSCTSSKHPREIMTEMVHTLSLHRVSFKQVSQWSMKCQRQTLRFEIDIAHLDDLDTIYVLRFKRVAGDLAQYKSLCSQLLAEMRL